LDLVIVAFVDGDMLMRVVILAAGTGSRLLPLTRNTPKSLIDLGDGYTLLERQLQAIGGAGIRDITIVTGYKSEQIEAKIQHYNDFSFTIVFNPFYRMANQIASAWMGVKDLEGPIVLLNGDDLFKPEVLKRLIEKPDDITLMACRKNEYSDEDMRVITEGQRVVDIGKDIPLDKTSAESIGMIHFSQRGLRDLQSTLQRMFRIEENLQLFFPASLRQMIREGYTLTYRECSEDEWSEVDFHPDLQLMRKKLQESLPHWE
jgi:L-glutamine-phosphate cytidylyltransferase